MNKLLSSIFVPLVLLSLGAAPQPARSRRAPPPSTFPLPPGPPGPAGPPPGASLAAEPPSSPVPAAAAVPAGACPARVSTGLRRSALTRTLDAGLGSWLRGVTVAPQLDGKRFEGWVIRSLHVKDPCFADIDLRPGDIVSRVNHRPIGRPEEAFAVWTSLRSAREIVVDYTRAGESRTFRIDVVD
jgi:hypothetical protein